LTLFNLPFAYTQDGKSIQVFYDGVQLVPSDDYTETSSTSVTATQSLVTGSKIAFRTISAAGTALAVTSLRENYVVGTSSGNYTGSTTVFNLINTYTPGGINLQVYLDGDLQTVGASNDYVETNSTTVTFNNTLIAGQTVAFLFSQASVGVGGLVSSGTANTFAVYASSGSTVSSISANTSAGGFKITNLANGTASTDAAAFGQIYYGFQPAIQVLDSTNVTTTSSTFQNTSLTASIIPTSSTHRIRITVMGSAAADTSANVCRVSIKRGSTIFGGTHGLVGVSAGTNISIPCAMSYIDSPATTSSTTYTVVIASSNNSSTVEWQPDGNAQSSIILEEIV
jgi:hypothetical protein